MLYEVVGNGGPISVDGNGDVKIIGGIDYEATKRYAFDVKVSDNGSPKLSSFGKLIVEVRVYIVHHMKCVTSLK